jgi:hypothetical protein
MMESGVRLPLLQTIKRIATYHLSGKRVNARRASVRRNGAALSSALFAAPPPVG